MKQAKEAWSFWTKYHRKGGHENITKQGRKRPLDTPKRMIKRREREGKREKER